MTILASTEAPIHHHHHHGWINSSTDMKRTGALKPHRAAPIVAKTGDVAALHLMTATTTVIGDSHRNRHTMANIRPPSSYMFFFFAFMLFYGDCFSVVLANDNNGDIMNGYSLGPDMTSTTEFGELFFFFISFHKWYFILCDGWCSVPYKMCH